MDEKTALTHLQQGKLDGLEWLVEKYQVQAVYTAHLILLDPFLAEDAAQTAFLRVVDKIHQFESNRPFAPWFFKIVINEALQLTRHHQMQTSLDDPADEDGADWLADSQLLPEAWLETAQAQDDIFAALQKLSPEQRAVTIMRYYLELNEKEMSARLQKPLSAIKWWLRTARERLKLLLFEYRQRS